MSQKGSQTKKGKKPKANKASNKPVGKVPTKKAVQKPAAVTAQKKTPITSVQATMQPSAVAAAAAAPPPVFIQAAPMPADYVSMAILNLIDGNHKANATNVTDILKYVNDNLTKVTLAVINGQSSSN